MGTVTHSQLVSAPQTTAPLHSTGTRANECQNRDTYPIWNQINISQLLFHSVWPLPAIKNQLKNYFSFDKKQDVTINNSVSQSLGHSRRAQKAWGEEIQKYPRRKAFFFPISGQIWLVLTTQGWLHFLKSHLWDTNLFNKWDSVGCKNTNTHTMPRQCLDPH